MSPHICLHMSKYLYSFLSLHLHQCLFYHTFKLAILVYTPVIIYYLLQHLIIFLSTFSLVTTSFSFSHIFIYIFTTPVSVIINLITCPHLSLTPIQTTFLSPDFPQCLPSLHTWLTQHLSQRHFSLHTWSLPSHPVYTPATTPVPHLSLESARRLVWFTTSL